MALTKSEELELAKLEAEETALLNRASSNINLSSGLTPQEERELQVLEHEEAIANGTIQQEQPSWYQPALDTVSAIGNKIDSYSGAPTRAAVEQFIKPENITRFARGDVFGALSQPAQAFGNQFGQDPALAPTGKQLAVQVGIPEDVGLSDISPKIPQFLDPTSGVDQQLRQQGFSVQSPQMKLIEKNDPLDISPAGAAGLVGDMTLDVTNLIPFGFIAKGVAKGGKAAAQGVKKGGEYLLKKSAKAQDLADGVETLYDISKKSGKSVKEGLEGLINPREAFDFNKLKEVASREGIDLTNMPESIQYGKDSAVSRKARGIAEGPLGDKKLKDFTESRNRVDEAFDRVVSEIGGGNVLKPVSAGQFLRDSYYNATEGFLSQIDNTYKTIGQQVPGMTLTNEAAGKLNSKLIGIEKYAKGLQLRGFTKKQRTQSKQLMDAVGAVKRAKNYKQLVEQMQTVGKEAFSDIRSYGGDIPPDIEKLQSLYRSMSESIVDTVRGRLGDDLADNLVANNKAMTEFFGKTSDIGKTIADENIAPEVLYERLIKNADTNTVEKLRRFLPKKDFDILKASRVNELVSLGAEDYINYTTTKKALTRAKNISAFLSEGDANRLGDILNFGERLGNPVLSTSGSGGSVNFLGDIKQRVLTLVENEAVLEAMKKRGEKIKLSGDNQLVKPPARPKDSKFIKAIDNPKVRATAAGTRAVSIQEREKREKRQKAIGTR